MSTTAPLTYAPLLLAMRATAYGAAVARLHPSLPPATVEQLMVRVAAHEAAMARAARELQVPAPSATAARAKRLRNLDTTLAGLLPTATRKAI